MGTDEPTELADPVEGSAADPLLTTGDMARITGNTLRTVRFYEETGILTPERRSPGGHRLFGQRQLERLHFISDMRAAGLSLEAIRGLLALKDQSDDGGAAAEATVTAIAQQLSSIEDKIAQLERVRDELKSAQAILQHCRDCTNERCFPDACSDCEVIKSQPRVPQSMRVLWDISPGTNPERVEP